MPEALTRKIGPLPLWGWIALVGVGGMGFVIYERRRKARSGTAASLAGAPAPYPYDPNAGGGSAGFGGGAGGSPIPIPGMPISTGTGPTAPTTADPAPPTSTTTGGGPGSSTGSPTAAPTMAVMPTGGVTSAFAQLPIAAGVVSPGGSSDPRSGATPFMNDPVTISSVLGGVPGNSGVPSGALNVQEVQTGAGSFFRYQDPGSGLVGYTPTVSPSGQVYNNAVLPGKS